MKFCLENQSKNSFFALFACLFHIECPCNQLDKHNKRGLMTNLALASRSMCLSCKDSSSKQLLNKKCMNSKFFAKKKLANGTDVISELSLESSTAKFKG